MFDEKTYYEGKGCTFYVISEREEVVDVGRWNLGEALRLEQERCCAVLKEMMPEEGGRCAFCDAARGTVGTHGGDGIWRISRAVCCT